MQAISDLHRRNLAALGDGDVVVASYGGSGQALVGNVLLELGLNYVDAYTEELAADGTARPSPRAAAYRARFAATSDRDDGRAPRTWPRFVKSHLRAEWFAPRPLRGVWLLVRDPRDALYSWYRWRVSFAEEPWDVVDGSFGSFIAGPDFGGRRPTEDWAAFYAEWSVAARERGALAITRFEDLKREPARAVRDALGAFGVRTGDADLERAVDRSSLDSMRAHEAAVSGAPGRIMRSGKVEGWREWMTPALASAFAVDELWRVAATFGYGRG